METETMSDLSDLDDVVAIIRQYQHGIIDQQVLARKLEGQGVLLTEERVRYERLERVREAISEGVQPVVILD
jgi:hypothetical protein